MKRNAISIVSAGLVLAGCSAPPRPSPAVERSTAAAPLASVVEPEPSSAYGRPMTPPGPPAADDESDASKRERDLPLFALFPALAEALPVARIGRWPTPVSAHPHVARALGLGELWLKRDDRSAEPYGGGKPRKLELLLGRAAAEGRDTVITFGGVGSHHALATALYAPRHGLEAVLLLLPQPRSDEVRQVLLASHRAGAELVMAGSMTAARRLAEARRAARPERVAILAPGGSEPLGNVGFVSAGVELAGQIERGALPEPDVIFLALGTMGSAIGLDIGLVAAGRPIPIVAVRASSRPISTRKKLRRMYAETVAFLRARDASFPAVRLDEERFVVADRFLGKGYAQPTVAGRAAIRFGAEHDLSLEATYTAKAFAALRAAAEAELKGKRVLFWQSHAGQPLDLADVDPADLPHAFAGWVAR